MHQWDWSYEYPDFLDSNNEFIEFDSFIITVLESSNSSIVENGRIPISKLLNEDVTPDSITVKAETQFNTSSYMKYPYQSLNWETNARFTVEENREVCQRLSDYKINHPDLPLRVINISGEPRVCTPNNMSGANMTGWFLSAIRR